MPHLVLEYSGNLALEEHLQPLFAQIHQAMVDSEVAPLADIKSRAMAHHTFHIGDGAAEHAFVHLQVRLLSGRDSSVRARLTQLLLGLLRDALGQLKLPHNCQLSVEIREMERSSYLKERIEPTAR